MLPAITATQGAPSPTAAARPADRRPAGAEKKKLKGGVDDQKSAPIDPSLSFGAPDLRLIIGADRRPDSRGAGMGNYVSGCFGVEPEDKDATPVDRRAVRSPAPRAPPACPLNRAPRPRGCMRLWGVRERGGCCTAADAGPVCGRSRAQQHATKRVHGDARGDADMDVRRRLRLQVVTPAPGMFNVAFAASAPHHGKA